MGEDREVVGEGKGRLFNISQQESLQPRLCHLSHTASPPYGGEQAEDGEGSMKCPLQLKDRSVHAARRGGSGRSNDCCRLKAL